MQITHFERSLDELVQMGYSKQNAEQERDAIEHKKIGAKLNFTEPFE